MQKQNGSRIFLNLVFLTMAGSLYCASSNSYAAAQSDTNLAVAKETIKNLEKTLANTKKLTSLPVLFPNQIPATDARLYATSESYHKKPNYDQFWQISITADPACTAHVCTVGSISAEKDTQIAPNYQEATSYSAVLKKQTVRLNNNITGYFTPSHADADWHPAQLEWQNNNVHYTVSWQLSEEQNEQQILALVANSAIDMSRTG